MRTLRRPRRQVQAPAASIGSVPFLLVRFPVAFHELELERRRARDLELRTAFGALDHLALFEFVRLALDLGVALGTICQNPPPLPVWKVRIIPPCPSMSRRCATRC